MLEETLIYPHDHWPPWENPSTRRILPPPSLTFTTRSMSMELLGNSCQSGYMNGWQYYVVTDLSGLTRSLHNYTRNLPQILQPTLHRVSLSTEEKLIRIDVSGMLETQHDEGG